MKRTYNAAIDYWKFFFAIMVVEYHRTLIYGGSVGGGYIAVDFFFVTTGYFMIQSFIEHREKNQEIEVGKQLYYFLAKKFKKIYPYILFNCITSFFMWQKDTPLIFILNRIRQIVFEILLLNMAGFSEQARYVNWYVSAMFLGMLILYPILLFFQEKYIYVISPILAILIYGWISQNVGSIIGKEFAYYGILRLGVWRAIAGICLGSLCWIGSDYLSRIQWNTLGKVLISLGMLLSIAIIVSNAIFYPWSQQDFISILFIVIFCMMLFSQKGILFHAYNFKVGKWLREWSVALFFMAGFGSNVMKKVFPHSMKLQNSMYYLGAFVSAGMAIMILKILKLLSQKKEWKRIFLLKDSEKELRGENRNEID